jgi:hypothetical protein
MPTHEPDFGRREFRVFERQLQRDLHRFDSRLRDVIAIRIGAEPYDFGMNSGTARARMFKLFDDQSGGALTYHQAVAITVKRTWCCCGGVILCTCGIESIENASLRRAQLFGTPG